MRIIEVPRQYQTDYLVFLVWIVFLTFVHKYCELYFNVIALVTFPMMVIYYFKSPYAQLRKKFKAAIIYMNREQYSEAVKIWLDILETKPSPVVYAILANCYAETEQPELAVKYMRRYLEKYPNNFWGNICYGIYLNRNNQNDKAVEVLRSLKAKVKKEEDIHVLASAFRYVKRPDLASEVLLKSKMKPV